MHRPVLLVLLLSLTWVSRFGDGHLIDGIFTEPTLEPGYNLVATVPRGALTLNVTELRHTQNYLAIRLQDGTYLLNGNYSINWSGEYQAAGTTFVYFRQSPQNLESFSAEGPLQEPIDVMVLYQEPNPGIVYRYSVPGNGNVLTNPHHAHKTAPSKSAEPGLPSIPHRKGESSSSIGDGGTSYPTRRYKKRKFAWRASGYTECSKYCGGGFQTLRHVCIREHTQTQVPDKRCHALEKPREIRQRCNTRPCPPKWRGGPWSECSVSCGKGIRIRELECVQEVKPSLTMRIADGACVEPNTLATVEPCEMQLCENAAITTQPIAPPAQWTVGTWSECSTSCGPGKRTRHVTCDAHDRSCKPEEKPDTQEACDLGSCVVNPPHVNSASTRLQSPQWLYTEWTEQCSAECGTGVQTRKVFCEKNPEEEYCDQSNRPETSRNCSSSRACSGQWFTGPWTECSTECDSGEQLREVVCVTTLRGSLRVVLDMNCPANKPDTKKSCHGPPCTSTWFISDWTECSRPCGKGIQKREVRCLTREGSLPESHEAHCREENRPVSRRSCNDYPCKEDHEPENHHRVLQVQNDPEISNGLEENPLCKDSISNCNLVIQARLCSYQFYQHSCCHSCSRAKQDME